MGSYTGGSPYPLWVRACAAAHSSRAATHAAPAAVCALRQLGQLWRLPGIRWLEPPCNQAVCWRRHGVRGWCGQELLLIRCHRAGPALRACVHACTRQHAWLCRMILCCTVNAPAVVSFLLRAALRGAARSMHAGCPLLPHTLPLQPTPFPTCTPAMLRHASLIRRHVLCTAITGRAHASVLAVGGVAQVRSQLSMQHIALPLAGTSASRAERDRAASRSRALRHCGR